MKRNWLQRLVLFFFDRSKVTLAIWLVLLAGGAAGYTTLLQREGFPPFELPVVAVRGQYFAGDAAEVDGQAAQPIYELISERADVKQVNSSSGANTFNIEIEFEDGTDPVAAARELNETAEAENVLPKGATVNFTPVEFGVDPDFRGEDILIAFYSDKDVPHKEFTANAEAAVESLRANNELGEVVERVRLIEQEREGVDPATGETTRERRTFDRVASRTDRNDFRPAATIAIKGQAGTDELELHDRAAEAIEKLRETGEFDGYDAVISASLAGGIRDQISSLEKNMLTGLLAVLAVTFLMIGLRAALVTALSMLSVMAATVAAMYAIGYSLNTVTLFSLILLLGLIVDDTIIVTEAIDVGRRKKTSARKAVAAAVQKIARASAAGTFTTILAFAPLLFIGGFLGDVIRFIPVTIIISLAISLILSLTLVPFLAKFLLLKPGIKHGLLAKVESFAAGKLAAAVLVGRRSMRRLVGVGLGAIGFSLAVIVAGVMLFGQLTFDIFPAPKDANEILLSLSFPSRTEIEEAESITDDVYAAASRELGDLSQEATLGGTGFAPVGTSIMFRLVPYDERGQTAVQLTDNLNQIFSDYERADVKAQQVGVGPPAGEFSARVFYDADRRQAALRLAGDIREFLRDTEFTRPDGSTFRTGRAAVGSDGSVQRTDGEAYVSAEAAFEDDDISALVTITQAAVEEEFTPEKVRSYGLADDALRFDFGAESDNQESFMTMLYALPVLVLLMYLLLVVQFRSLLQPLLIFMAVPFSVFGVAGGLYLTDNPFSFFTMIAVFALIGISVNNTILLVDYANRAKREGMRQIDAVAQAVRLRFRPLIATSATAVIALTPLALNDPFWQSLAVALMFGLLSSTFLVIVAFPYYYLASEYLRLKISRKQVLLWLLAAGASAAVLVMSGNSQYLPLLFIILILFVPAYRILRRIA